MQYNDDYIDDLKIMKIMYKQLHVHVQVIYLPRDSVVENAVMDNEQLM